MKKCVNTQFYVTIRPGIPELNGKMHLILLNRGPTIDFYVLNFA